MGRETICHTLFSCKATQDVWRTANLPMPPLGLSANFVFLNLHHLVACTKNKDTPSKLMQSIPWILWHIWKARNGLLFEKIRLSPSAIVNKAEEEACSWFTANHSVQNAPQNHHFESPHPIQRQVPVHLREGGGSTDSAEGQTMVIQPLDHGVRALESESPKGFLNKFRSLDTHTQYTGHLLHH